jgi:3-oxoacyl-[acyl-carrier protein] reductase
LLALERLRARRMNLGIDGKVAIVTGGAGGIGAAICERLCEQGVRVVVADYDQAKAKGHADLLTRNGGTAIALRVDVTQEEEVDNLAAKTLEHFKAAHILVNNAGFTRDMRISKMQLKDWNDVQDVILKGAFLCSRAFVPIFAEQRWGRIVNMSSRAYLGNRGQVNYSAAKAGILGFTRALSLEVGSQNITVNAIAPGIINTEAVRNLRHFDSVREAAEKTTPIPRLGEPSDVADATAFLVSDRAGYITGDVMHVTGGRY